MRPCGLGDFRGLINVTPFVSHLDVQRWSALLIAVQWKLWQYDRLQCHNVPALFHVWLALERGNRISSTQAQIPFLLPPCGHMAVSVALRTLLMGQDFLCKTLLKHTLKMWHLPLPAVFLLAPVCQYPSSPKLMVITSSTIHTQTVSVPAALPCLSCLH